MGDLDIRSATGELRSMGFPQRFRSVLCVVMLVATGIAVFEPVIGEIGDVLEHYGNVESGSVGPDVLSQHVEIADGHSGEHVKAFDHCSHAHGASARCPSLELPSIFTHPIAAAPLTSARHGDVPASKLFHPPKA